MDAAGDFVVVWESWLQDGSDLGIYAKRFNAFGVPQGSEFRVNTYTNGRQNNPSVGMDADGDFVIAWDGNGPNDSAGIYAQRYSSSGVPQGGEVQVNAYTTGTQNSVSLAMDADGEFVIVWTSSGRDDDFDVYAQRYDAMGVALGDEFRVNTFTTDRQWSPSVAMDRTGDFIIAWSWYGPPPRDVIVQERFYGISAQRYGADGIPQGIEFQVSSLTTLIHKSPTVAMDDVGDFVVAWYIETPDDQTGLPHTYDIHAQCYYAAGGPRGFEFCANTYTTMQQWSPSVAMDGDGNFVIAWRSEDQESDGESYVNSGIYAQRFGQAPAVSAGVAGPTTTVRGEPTSFTLTATGTPANPAETFTYNIDWDGNGTIDQTVVGLGTGTVVQHVFAQTGSATFTVTATDSLSRTSPRQEWTVNTLAYTLRPNGGLTDLILGGADGSDFYSFWGIGGNDLGIITGDLGIVGVYGVTGSIYVYMQGGDDTVTIESGISGRAFVVDGGEGFNIMAPLKGSNSITYTGGSGIDQFFLVAGPNNTVTFSGGGGDDVFLDVSGDSSNTVTVYGQDGNDGAATSSHASYLDGGNGNDMLVSFGGSTTQIGGNGDDFLVGGSGPANLSGGAGSDLIVAGSLVFLPEPTDGYVPIWTEWGFSGNSFATRKSNIETGATTSGYTITNGSTALHNGAIDTILGGADADWLVYKFTQDLASDYTAGEDVRTNLI